MILENDTKEKKNKSSFIGSGNEKKKEHSHTLISYKSVFMSKYIKIKLAVIYSTNHMRIVTYNYLFTAFK